MNMCGSALLSFRRLLIDGVKIGVFCSAKHFFEQYYLAWKLVVSLNRI